MTYWQSEHCPLPGLASSSLMEPALSVKSISFCENRSKSSNFLRMRRLKEIETPQVSLTPQQGWGSAPKLDYSRERFINFLDLLFYLKIIPCENKISDTQIEYRKIWRCTEKTSLLSRHFTYCSILRTIESWETWTYLNLNSNSCESYHICHD